MKKAVGFFTRQDAQRMVRRKAPKKGNQMFVAKQLGIKGVKDMNPDAKCPNMRFCVDEMGQVLLLGLAPNKASDLSEEPFCGVYGLRFRHFVGKGAFGYIVPTWPKNPVNEFQIEAFREHVTAQIEAIKPKVILAMGTVVLDWLVPGVGYSDRINRGRKFNVTIGDHRCWVIATYGQDQTGKFGKKYKDGEGSGADHWGALKWDFTNANDLLFDPPPTKYRTDESFLRKVIREFDYVPFAALNEFHLDTANEFAVDIETFQKWPSMPGARILTIAISNGLYTLSFPIDHPDAKIEYTNRLKLICALRLIFKGRTVIAHNALFEIQWFLEFLGPDIAYLVKGWVCTQVLAYHLDVREGQSLDYQTQQYLGFALKSLSGEKLWDAIGKMKELIWYNGQDAHFTWHVFQEQKKRNSHEAYTTWRYRMKRLAALAITNHTGLPVSQETVGRFYDEFSGEIQTQVDVVRNSDEGKDFAQKVGLHFDFSDKHKAIMLRDILKIGDGKSVAKPILEGLDHPIVDQMILVASMKKTLSTYIDRLRVEHKDSYVFADGKIRPQLVITRAKSGRLATRDPNLNFPKRSKMTKKVRSIIQVPEGWTMICADLTAAEACVIAMFSEDETLVDFLHKKDADIHMHWTDFLIDLDPSIMEVQGVNTRKELRGIIKNKMVFPLYFGAGFWNIKNALGLPDAKVKMAIEKFWSVHAGVKEWQLKTEEFYKKYGYIETLTGLRRSAPLKYNMLLNSGVQGTSADLCVDAFVRQSEIAHGVVKLEDAPCDDLTWLQPNMNIHDDNTTLVPDQYVEWAIPVIAKTLVCHDYDFINVPIRCEVETGKDWAKTKSVAKFETKDFQ